MSDTGIMIKAIGLTKRFGARAAVERASFEIGRGQVVGFLGPNGAGKTTTMRLLTGYLPADEGRAELLGLDVAERTLAVRRRLGYLPEDNPLREEFETADALELTARLRGLLNPAVRRERIKAVIKSCGLAAALGKRAGELSKGYRQRLGLAQAILHDPEVLILDEPTSGLDPNQVAEVRGLIKELGRDKTVLISTHILAEVEATCSRALIISGGRIVADGDPRELSGAGKARLYAELKAPREAALSALRALSGVSAEPEGAGFTLEPADGRDLREELFALCVEKRWPILALRPERPSLEQVFRELTRSA